MMTAGFCIIAKSTTKPGPAVSLGVGTLNTKQTYGITVDQLGYDDEILALKSSTDVAHGITDFAETTTYGHFKKADAAQGGMNVWGFTEGTYGLDLAGLGVTDITTKGTGGAAYVLIDAHKKSGTGTASPGADANLLAIRSRYLTRFIFDQEGEMHCDAVIGAGDDWDEWDDLALASDLSRLPAARWDEMMRYHAEDFERAGLLTLSEDKDGTRHAFIKTKAMLQFYACCFREVDQRLQEVYGRMLKYEQALVQLGVSPTEIGA